MADVVKKFYPEFWMFDEETETTIKTGFGKGNDTPLEALEEGELHLSMFPDGELVQELVFRRYAGSAVCKWVRG